MIVIVPDFLDRQIKSMIDEVVARKPELEKSRESIRNDLLCIFNERGTLCGVSIMAKDEMDAPLEADQRVWSPPS